MRFAEFNGLPAKASNRTAEKRILLAKHPRTGRGETAFRRDTGKKLRKLRDPVSLWLKKRAAPILFPYAAGLLK
jgi:hypothetical protein